MATEKQIHANQENAKLSTGPSEEGKANSAGNNFKHGLCPTDNFFALLKDEDPEAFICLLDALHTEHAPEGPTEVLLVRHMAQSEWLRGRADLLQTQVLHAKPEDMEKKLSLYMRYGKTHQNNFYKALNQLIKLRKEKALSEIGFKSQELKIAAANRAVEAQIIKKEALAFQKEQFQFKKEVQQAKQTPVPAPPAPSPDREMAA